MVSVKQRHLRDRRDHLIDLLGLGTTYPLQDLPLYLSTDPYLVTYNTPARIGVESSQRTVLYQLHEARQLVERTAKGEAGPGIPVERPGNRARIRLSSYNIQDDKAFQVYATKFTYRFALPTSFTAELDALQVSEALRQAFETQGGITLDSQVTVSLEKQPTTTAATTSDTEGDIESEQPTLTWVLREGDDAQTGNRFLIRNLDSLLAVYAMSEQAAYLHETAAVKVDLDQLLNAWITDAPFLVDPIPEAQPLTAARLIDYNGTVTVEIENSQEGVYYRLIQGLLNNDGQYPPDPPTDNQGVISVEDDEGNGLGKLGTGENIVLTSQTIAEDIDIRIQATKTFPESPGRANETIFLDVILPLRVRANPAPVVTVNPASIIDFNQAPAITLDHSQSSVRYRLYHHQIVDWVPDREDDQPRLGAEIIHDNAEIIRNYPKPEVLTVNVPDELDDVQIVKPAHFHPWQNQAGYTMVGEALSGTDVGLSLPLPPLEADCIVLVKAEKSHRLEAFNQAESRLIDSAVQLYQAAVILVRPNPDQPLQLETVLIDNQTTGELAVFGGQPGVLYTFRPAPDADPLGWPTYFHKADALDQAQNKGLEQVTIGVDFAIARPHPDGQPSDLAHTPPPAPILDTGPLAEGTTLHLQAIKAQTRVKVAMAQTASIPALPEIRVEDPVVDYNKDTRLLVIASIVGDRYQPYLNGEIYKPVLVGNGNDRARRTDPLTEDTVYEMHVTRSASDQIALTRIVKLPILVRPNPALPVSLTVTEVETGGSSSVQVQASQVGVRYQLMISGDPPTPIGEAITGNGATIDLQTGPLTETTTFGVRATRLSNATIMADLAQTVTVTVTSNGG